MPRFCIVMPSYNSEETLGEALSSALRQRYDDFTVVLTDNGSSDRSASIAAGFDDPRLICHLHDDAVAKTDNWNRAYRDAPDCEYLVTLHADDRLHPDALRRIERAARGGPALIHGRVTIIDWPGQILRRLGFPLSYRATGSQFRRLALYWNLVAVPGATIRRDLFERVGAWNPDYNSMQDVDMWWHLGGYGAVHYTGQLLGDYRLREVSTTPAFAREYLRWFEERLSDPGLSPADRTAATANMALFRYNLSAHPHIARELNIPTEKSPSRNLGDPILRQRLMRLRLAVTQPMP